MEDASPALADPVGEPPRASAPWEPYLARARRLLGVGEGASPHEDAEGSDLEDIVDGMAGVADSVVVLSGPSWAWSEYTWIPVVLPLARRLPVYVIKPDLASATWTPEDSGVPNIWIWHVRRGADHSEWPLVHEALHHRGVRRPLVLTECLDSHAFVAGRFSALTVLFTDGTGSPDLLGDPRVQEAIEHADLVICASHEERESLAAAFRPAGTLVVSPRYRSLEMASADPAPASPQDTIFVPGLLDGSLDLALLVRVATRLPRWNFVVALPLRPEWADGDLTARENLAFLGSLPAAEWSDLARRAQVAFLPVNPDATALDVRQHALEMWACGLPVVAGPPCDMESRDGVLSIVCSSLEATRALVQLAASRSSADACAERLALALLVEGVSHPATVLKAAHMALFSPRSSATTHPSHRLNVLVGHDDPHACGGDGLDFLRSLGARSCHRVSYAAVAAWADLAVDLSAFDAVVVHHPARSLLSATMSQQFTSALRRYGGYKMLVLPAGSGGLLPSVPWLEAAGFHAVLQGAPSGSLRLPPDVEVVTVGDPREAAAVLGAHLGQRIRLAKGSELVCEVVGHIDPIDGLVRLSTVSYACGCPSPEILDAVPDQAVGGTSTSTLEGQQLWPS